MEKSIDMPYEELIKIRGEKFDEDGNSSAPQPDEELLKHIKKKIDQEKSSTGTPKPGGKNE